MPSQNRLRENFSRLNVTQFTTRWSQGEGEKRTLESICQTIMSKVNDTLLSLYQKNTGDFIYNDQYHFWDLFCDVADQIIDANCPTGTDVDRQLAIEIYQCMHSCYTLFELGLAHRSVTSQMFRIIEPTEETSTIVSLVYRTEKALSLANTSSTFGINADHPVTHIAHRAHPRLVFCESQKIINDQDSKTFQPDGNSIKNLYGTLIHDTVAFDAFRRVLAHFGGEIFYSSIVLIDAFDPHIRHLLQTPQGLLLTPPVFVYDPWPLQYFVIPAPLEGGDTDYHIARIYSDDRKQYYVTLVQMETVSDGNQSIDAGPRPDIYVESTRHLLARLDNYEKRLARVEMQSHFANRKIQEHYVEYSAVRQRELNVIFTRLEAPEHATVKKQASANITWPAVTRQEIDTIRFTGNQKVHGPNVLQDAVATMLTHNPPNAPTFADCAFAVLYSFVNVTDVSMLYPPSTNCPQVFRLPTSKPRRVAPYRSTIVRALNIVAWFHQCVFKVYKLKGFVYKRLDNLQVSQSLEARLDILYTAPHLWGRLMQRRNQLHEAIDDVTKQIKNVLKALVDAPDDHFRVPHNNELPESCQDNLVVFFDNQYRFGTNTASFLDDLDDLLILQNKIERRIIKDPGACLPAFSRDVLDYKI